MNRRSLFGFLAAALAVPMALLARSRLIDPRDYGAVGDGVTDDTAAFQTILNGRSPPRDTYQMGSTIYIPPGHTFLIGPLQLPTRAGSRF